MTDSRLAPVLHHLRRLTRPEEPADAALLARYAAGRDAAAFGDLVRRHGPLVWRVCRRVLFHGPDAEDAYQATFLALARRAGAIRNPAALAGWLHAAACRIACRLRQDVSRRPAIEATATPTPVADPAHEAAWRELGRLVEEEVAALPDKYRLPLLLCYWEGQTNDQAARRLDCPAGTLKTRLAKARQILQGRLTRRGVALPAGMVGLLLAPNPGNAAAPALAATASARILSLAGTAPILTTVKRLTAVLLLAIGFAVASAFAFPRQAPAPQAEAPSPGPPPARLDRFGDPLPDGVRARLGTARLRHGNGITLAFAPDGKSLRTFGGDRTFRTWDLASGRLLKEQRLPGELWRTLHAAFSPDGRLLTFDDDSGFGNHFFLWDVAGHRLLRKFVQRGISRERLVFSPDGKTLVTGDTLVAGTLRAWDVDTGQSRELGPHERPVHELSLAANGTLLVAMQPASAAVHLWDVKAGKKLPRLPVREKTLGAALSPDGRVAVSWRYSDAGGQTIQFHEAASGKSVNGWVEPNLKQVTTARFAPDGKTLWIGTQQGIVIWDPAAGKAVRTLPGGAGINLTFSPDGKTAAALGAWHAYTPSAPVVRIWDVATGAPHPANAAEQGHLDEVDGVAFSPDGRTVASCCSVEKSVRLWDATTGRLVRSLPVQDRLRPYALTFTADGKHLFVGALSAVVRWEVATGREVGRFPLMAAGEVNRYLLVMNPADDGRSLAVLSYNGRGQQFRLENWDVATGKRSRSVPISPSGMRSTDMNVAMQGRFTGDGRLFSHPGGAVYVAATGEEAFRLPAAQGQWLGEPLAFSPDGALVAAAVWKEHRRPGFSWPESFAVQVWESATLFPVARLETAAVGRLAFTPDGRRFLTAGREALVLWDLASGKEVTRRAAPSAQFGSHLPSFVSSLAWAPDGRTAATGHADTNVLLWDFPAPERPAAPPTAKEREALWHDLAGPDAGRAMQAIARLAGAPAQAVAMARLRVRPAQQPPAGEVRRLIDQFDSPRFEARAAATKRLAEFGEGAHVALREAMREQPSLEVRRRIEPLLDRPFLVREAETRRALRAVRLLEVIGSGEARRVLEALARGADGMRLTDEARAALRRLDRPR